MRAYKLHFLSHLFPLKIGGWKIYTLSYKDSNGNGRTLFSDAYRNLKSEENVILRGTLLRDFELIIEHIKSISSNPNIPFPNLKSERMKEFEGKMNPFDVCRFPGSETNSQVRLYCAPIHGYKVLILFGGGRKFTQSAQGSPQTKAAISIANKATLKILQLLESRSFEQLLNTDILV